MIAAFFRPPLFDLAFDVELEEVRVDSAAVASLDKGFGLICIIFLDLPGGGGSVTLLEEESVPPPALPFGVEFEHIFCCFGCINSCCSSKSSSLSFLFCSGVAAAVCTADERFTDGDGDDGRRVLLLLEKADVNCAGIGAIGVYIEAIADTGGFPGDEGDGGYFCLGCLFLADETGVVRANTSWDVDNEVGELVDEETKVLLIAGGGN